MNSILYLIMFNILLDFLADHTSIPITDKCIYLYTLNRLLNGSPISYLCASGVIFFCLLPQHSFSYIDLPSKKTFMICDIKLQYNNIKEVFFISSTFSFPLRLIAPALSKYTPLYSH